MEHKLKKGKVQGSVLLTVLGVMFAMIFFLMATLTLTTAAQRRSYYTYFETQAQYAAQAALEAVTNDAYSDEAFFNYVSGGGTDISVSFDDTDIPIAQNDDGHKVVHCTIEPVDDNFIWDSKNGKVARQQAWKITATAAVGTGRNRAESSVANYIYSTVRSGAVASPDNTAAWTLVTGFDNKETTTDGSTHEETPYSNETGQGCVTLNGGSSDNISTFGPSTIGAYEYPYGRTKYGDTLTIIEHEWYTERNFTTSYQHSFSNDSKLSGDQVVINGAWLGGDSQIYSINVGQHIVVMGNLDVQNHMNFYSNTDIGTAVKYKDLPSLYVDSVISGQNIVFGYEYDSATQKSSTTNTTKTAANLYAGAIQTDGNKGFRIFGDMYLYDPEKSSYITADESTSLATFIDTNVTKSNYSGGYVGGDLICNNEGLEIGGGKFVMGGDLIFTNPKGKLKLSGGDMTVNGAVVLCGTVKADYKTINATGGIYVMPGAKFEGQQLTVNGKVVAQNGAWNYDGLADACAGRAEKKADGSTVANSATSAFIESLNLTATAPTTNNTYQGLCQAIRDARVDYSWDLKDADGNVLTNTDGTAQRHTYTGSAGYSADYDYSLFPFCSRLDEIFERYIRWDARDTDGKPGFASAAAAEAFTDALKEESEAAGHSWGSIGKDSTLYGTRYFPCTTPHDSGKNAFISELNTYDETSVVANYSYYDTYTKFCTHYNGGSELPDYTGAKQDVAIYSHDAAGGTASTTDTVNAYVVNTNCKVNIASDGGIGKSSDIIFIDPTFGNHDEKNPLVVAFYGSEARPKIVINNTAEYIRKTTAADGTVTSTVDYTKPYSYATEDATQQKHASRADVVIYFMGATGDPQSLGIGGENFYMLSSGMWKQWNADSIDFVTDVTYPGETGYAALPAKDKYKFELIPNDLVFMHAGTFQIKNGGIMTGAVIAPTTDFIVSSTNGTAPNGTKADVTYRPDYGTQPITWTRYVACIGSIFSKSFAGDNLPIVVFGGSVDISETVEDTEGTKVDVKTAVNTSDSNSAAANPGGDGNYFDNDHQAAG